MTYRVRSGKYEVCGSCGAHLDHGEKCDCGEQERTTAESGTAGAETAPLHI